MKNGFCNVKFWTGRPSSTHALFYLHATYNPRVYNIFHFMKQIEFNLNSSERMKNVLKKKKIINSKRQPKNMKRFLSSKVDFHESSPFMKKCTDKKCMTCPSLIEGTSFTFKNGRTFTVMQDISCKINNLVYAIISSNCGELYADETKTELRTRMPIH
jgi:ABC-type multidrug transport system fused ATPase/permease subunit